jgi:tetratricopeptide (TPR) repeat protein
MHNLGRALILRGDYFDAYVAISEASALERNESNEFLRFNEGVRGALDIMNGDYKLATIRLNRAPETPMNLFNKGLAYLLADELGSAAIAFEESVQSNREYGYGFYGLAVIAAISGDRQALFENLRKATERSEYLKERALRDILFKTYHSDPEFMNVFR